jgi:hypothetical protein
MFNDKLNETKVVFRSRKSKNERNTTKKGKKTNKGRQSTEMKAKDRTPQNTWLNKDAPEG